MFNFEIVINRFILIRLYMNFIHKKIIFVLFNYEINPLFECRYYIKYRLVR